MSDHPASGMTSGRLEAFTDGVVAIVITIMVLELQVPEDGSLAALSASAPILLAYVLSFIKCRALLEQPPPAPRGRPDRRQGPVANLFLLFWLSLVPFVIRWLDESGFPPWPPRPTAWCWAWPRWGMN